MRFQSKGGTDFEIPPAGNHLAICNAIVDLGMQPGSGQYPDPKHNVFLRFELCDELREFPVWENNKKTDRTREAPMTINRIFTASMGKKANLRKFIEGWRGVKLTDDEAGDFEFEKLLGQQCLLNVVHDAKADKTYANIASATPVPKSMKDVAKGKKQYNDSLFFSLETPDKKAFDALPKWLREKIENRIPEDKPIAPGVSVPEGDDSEIPF